MKDFVNSVVGCCIFTLSNISSGNLSICTSLSLSLSISLFYCQSNNVSIFWVSIYLSILLSICLSIYLFFYLSINLSICLSTWLSVSYVFIYLSIKLSICILQIAVKNSGYVQKVLWQENESVTSMPFIQGRAEGSDKRQLSLPTFSATPSSLLLAPHLRSPSLVEWSIIGWFYVELTSSLSSLSIINRVNRLLTLLYSLWVYDDR